MPQPPDPTIWRIDQRSKQIFTLTINNRLAMDFDFLSALHYLPDSKRVELVERLAEVVKEYVATYQEEQEERKERRKRRV